MLRVHMFLLTVCCTIGSLANAAPFPATASSALVRQSLGLYFQPYGFKMPMDADWLQQDESSKPQDENISGLSARFVNQKFPQVSISLETDALRAETTVESYAKKWMRDYANYGFEVLGAKTFQAGRQKGLVVDLQHKKRGIQIRQTIYIRKKQAVTLTCSGQSASFNKEIQLCNEVSRQFEWIN